MNENTSSRSASIGQCTLPLRAAQIFAHELRKRRNLLHIVNILSNAKVTKEVLESTTLERALGRYASDDIHGAKIRQMLFRFFRITIGKEEPFEEEKNKETTPKEVSTEEKEEKTMVKAIDDKAMRPNFPIHFAILKQKMDDLKAFAELSERKVSLKRKLEMHDKVTAKIRKILTSEHQFDDLKAPYKENLAKDLQMKDKKPVEKHFQQWYKDVETQKAKILAHQLMAIPPSPSPEDVEPLVEGLSAAVLRKAEDFIGRRMNRVDALWWSLLYRDFGRFGGQWTCGIREVYCNYEALLN